ESQERLQRFFDASEDGILFHRDGVILDANEKLARLVDSQVSEVVGRKVRDLVDPASRRRLDDAIRLGGEESCEVIGLTSDGSKLPLEVIGKAVTTSDGSAQVTILRDITERKRSERTARELESKYRKLFETTRDAIYISRPDGSIEDVNPAAVKMMGFSCKQEMLRADSRTFYQNTADREKLLELIERQGYVRDYEVKLNDQQGQPLIIEQSITAERAEHGTVVAFRGVARDVTRQRALEQGLRQSQKMEAIGRLAGGVAHDFNNLLTAINGYTELSLSELEADTPVREHLKQIRSAGDRAATLTRQLLALSRQQVLEPRVLDLNVLVGEFEKLLHRTIGEDIFLETVLEGESWHVKADPGQLEQVLMNLAVNARDAMRDGGRLTIETRNIELDGSEIGHNVAVEPGPYALLLVTDTGCGMDAQTLNRVFEPFFTTKEEGKGTGLGLATVYGIVKQSGGYISIYSEPGEGTTVKIYLPRVWESPERQGARSRRRPAATTEPKTILLAEDNPMVRKLVARVLQELGHKVLIADTPEAALRISAEYPEPLDLLFTDLVMPEMSGLQLAERITEQRPETLLLVMSGYSKEAKFSNDPLAVNASFIQKPFTPESLARAVTAAFERQAQDAKTVDASDAT
ncbi:MAG: PAS domain-containing protein, partial [Thermoanaerobaculia bacterium]